MDTDKVINMVFKASKNGSSKQGPTSSIGKTIGIKTSIGYGSDKSPLAGIESFKKKQSSYFGTSNAQNKNVRIQERRESQRALGSIMGNLQSAVGSTFGSGAEIKKEGRSVNVYDQFQKYNYKYVNGGFGFGGVDVVVPEGYKRVGDKIVPIQQEKFISRYDKDKEVNKKGKTVWDTNIDYSYYNPVEAYLTPEGKLSKVVERGVFQERYLQTPEEKEYRQKTYEKNVTMFDDNIKKSAIFKDVAKTTNKQYSDYRKIEREPYLKQQVNYDDYSQVYGQIPRMSGLKTDLSRSQVAYQENKPKEYLVTNKDTKFLGLSYSDIPDKVIQVIPEAPKEQSLPTSSLYDNLLKPQTQVQVKSQEPLGFSSLQNNVFQQATSTPQQSLVPEQPKETSVLSKISSSAKSVWNKIF